MAIVARIINWDINERVDRKTDNKIGNWLGTFAYIRILMRCIWAQIYFLKDGSNIWINWNE